MSMQYIRDSYKVPAKRGAKVRYTGDPGPAHVGTIIGSQGPYLRCRFPTYGDGQPYLFHPTWCMTYL